MSQNLILVNCLTVPPLICLINFSVNISFRDLDFYLFQLCINIFSCKSQQAHAAYWVHTTPHNGQNSGIILLKIVSSNAHCISIPMNTLKFHVFEVLVQASILRPKTRTKRMKREEDENLSIAKYTWKLAERMHLCLYSRKRSPRGTKLKRR